MTEYRLHTLPNGLRLLFKYSVSPVSHCCLMINAGSRDEADGKDGLAHFIEHLLFKQTERRNTTQILNYLEAVGADVNAYTTKEYTCLHASLLKQYAGRAFDLFHDLVFHSTFPDNELVKERSVIQDEIASYLDQPEEAIMDDFEALLFNDHPMGNNILGTPETVQNLNKADIAGFREYTYNTGEMVFGVCGDHDFNQLIRLFSKYFEPVLANKAKKLRAKPKPAQGSAITAEKAISQTHGVIGGGAYSSASHQKYGLLFLNNLLGGAGLSSRLNMQIREKYGIAYTIESNYTPFSDSGIFSIYFGTDAEKAGKAVQLISCELKKLRDSKLSETQMHQAKKKFTGQIALAEENRLSLLLSMCKSLLDFDRVDTLEEIFNKINAVTAPQLLDIANEIFDETALNTLLFQPQA